MRASKNILGWVLACFTFLAVTPALAVDPVPMRLSHQGRLLDAQKNPVSGAHALKFSIYSDATAGTQLWTETQQVTLNSTGNYAVVLGTVTPFPGTLFSGQPLYLSIAIDTGSDLSPRQPITSTPYAITAGNAVGDITPRSVSVNGATVIDSTGKWVGAEAVYYAEQNADLWETTAGTWTDLPNAAVTFNVDSPTAIVDVYANGSVTDEGGTDSFVRCAFRILFDGAPLSDTDPNNGDLLASPGKDISGPAEYVPFVVSRRTTLNNGSHTIKVQMNTAPAKDGVTSVTTPTDGACAVWRWTFSRTRLRVMVQPQS